jgi:hypothetical protein
MSENETIKPMTDEIEASKAESRRYTRSSCLSMALGLHTAKATSSSDDDVVATAEKFLAFIDS